MSNGSLGLLFAFGLWLVLPIVLLFILMRLTRQLSGRGSLRRYFFVCWSPVVLVVLVIAVLPPSSVERYPHFGPEFIFGGMPATIYFLLAHLTLAVSSLYRLGK